MNNRTMESWYWKEDHFRKLHPLLKYDFDNNASVYYLAKYFDGIVKIMWYLFAFAVISSINAIFIRVTLKISSLMIFPMISLQNRFTR